MAKRFMRFSNSSDKNSSTVRIYNKRHDFMGEKKKSEVRNWLNLLQLEKFNKLNFNDDIEEINLLVEEF
jgi:hypothetical protein